MKDRPTIGSTAPVENSIDADQEQEDTPSPRSTLLPNNNEDEPKTPNRRHRKKAQKITTYESTLLNILQQKQKEELDEQK